MEAWKTAASPAIPWCLYWWHFSNTLLLLLETVNNKCWKWTCEYFIRLFSGSTSSGRIQSSFSRHTSWYFYQWKCYFPSGAASEWRVRVLEMCEERDPEGRPGGPGGLREPVLSDQVRLDDDLEKKRIFTTILSTDVYDFLLSGLGYYKAT